MKKLYKSNTDEVFAGVLGGIGEYFNIDPTILRLTYVLISILTGIVPAVIGYIIAVAIMPKKPFVYHMPASEYEEKTKTPEWPIKKEKPAQKAEEKKHTEPKTEESTSEKEFPETDTLDL